MTQPTEPILRPMRDPEDRAEMFRLHEAVTGQPFGNGADANAYFEWLYVAQAEGRMLATAAFVGERMVAFYGIVPWRMRVDGKDVAAAQSLNSMTHPDFQRRGLFAKLGMLAYRETCKDVPVVFGFPNENALPPRATRLGWVGLRPVPRYVLLLAPPALPSKLRGLPGAATGLRVVGRTALGLRAQVGELAGRWAALRGGLQVRALDAMPDDVEALWQTVRDDYRVSVVRDLRYLRWRYDAHPLYTYQRFGVWRDGRLQGLAVLRTNGTGPDLDVYVTEWLVRDDIGIQLALAQAVVHVARSLRARSVVLLDSFRRSDATALTATGFLPLPTGQGRFWLVPGVRRNSEAVSAETLFHIDHWRLSFGDVEIW